MSAPAGYTPARIEEPVLGDGFPRVLGIKVGQWAQDGVQQVWLDIHPADMGPVAIQIALDGQQAELNFGAESASARQAIESSLPELAAALQGAGLTLSGGSISQQLPQSQDRSSGHDPTGGDGPRNPPNGRESGAAVNSAVPPQRRPTGLVDLYA